MANVRWPRHGSMQFWPRKRASRPYARVHSRLSSKDVVPLGFAGYKAGMTHVILEDKRPNSISKGEKIAWPVTIIECPPMTIHSARFYKNTIDGRKLITEILNSKPKKNLKRRLRLVKSVKRTFESISNFDDITLVVHTNPELTGIGKKKPDIFEICLGGTKDQKLQYAKENLGKDLLLKDVVKDGMLTDVHGVTIGKGYQGVVKRFGVTLRNHKSQKSRRAAVQGPESYSRVLSTAPKGGKMGFHQRTIMNLLVLKTGDNPKDVNPDGGFVRYGVLKNPYMIVKGSVPGPEKRLAIFTTPMRPNPKTTMQGLTVLFINTDSKQGR